MTKCRNLTILNVLNVLNVLQLTSVQCQPSPPPQPQPTLVFIGFRHGARSVAAQLPGDINNDKWKVGVGQLTKDGMTQHYKNGGKVRARYAPMFDTYDATKSLMRSSPMDRTLMSAASFSASLYEPDDSQVFQNGLSWQPTAIYTVNFLSSDAITNELMNSVAQKTVTNLTQEDNEMVSILETATNISLSNSPSEFFELLDNLVTEQFAGFKFPYGLDDSYAPRIQHLKDCMFIEMFADPTMSCLLAPQILNDLVNKTDNYLNQETPKNAYVYSMHDANVFSLVSLLNGYNQQSPPFAATVFFEIWPNDQNNGYLVKLLYRPFLDQEPQELEINNCGTPCSYDDFKNVTRNIEQNCNFDPNSATSC